MKLSCNEISPIYDMIEIRGNLPLVEQCRDGVTHESQHMINEEGKLTKQFLLISLFLFNSLKTDF